MLYKLAMELSRPAYGNCESIVICLGPRGGVSDDLAAAGFEVHYFDLRKGPSALLGLAKLAALTRRIRPDVLQGWMYDGNLAATVAGAFFPAPVYWSVHQALYALRYEKPVNRFIILASALVSGMARAIVYVSTVSVAQHARIGFSSRGVVIPIGFDLEAFRPMSPELRRATRESLGLEASRTWIGWVGRNQVIKDPGNFIAAACAVAAVRPEARFLMLGRGFGAPDSGWRARVREQGLEDRFTFRDETRDITSWIPALDILVSSSYSEGFPNVIGEAMSAGLPCVVTDVGDSAWLLGDTGKIIPPRDPEALARAMNELLALDEEARADLGARARARIRERFTLATVAERYLALYEGR